jgi:nucleoside-diphosphate-sugar epimerase
VIPAFTVLGAGGRIGRALVAALRPACPVQAVDRAGLAAFLASRRAAGHIINCIGLTGDFRSRPLATADAHVGVTAQVLARGQFSSFLYLSSTRVYARVTTTREDARLVAEPADPSDVYNLTKLAGEALCLADPRPTVRVVRLSNVVHADPDPDTFLGQLLLEGQATGRVRLRQGPGSAKDYVSIDGVVALLPRIAAAGRHRLYNLAAGRNTTHAAIAAWLRASYGWDVGFDPNAPDVIFPTIDTARLATEFPFALSDPLPGLATMPAGQEAPCSPSTKRVVA